jgi:hypothetical protein
MGNHYNHVITNILGGIITLVMTAAAVIMLWFL